jgi:hypothetical protein
MSIEHLLQRQWTDGDLNDVYDISHSNTCLTLSRGNDRDGELVKEASEAAKSDISDTPMYEIPLPVSIHEYYLDFKQASD